MQGHQRMTKVGKKEREESMRLLDAMGLPQVHATSEAESQCAELCKKGIVWGVSTEDMDTLCFGAQNMVRHLGNMRETQYSQQGGRKQVQVEVINLEKMLEKFEMNMEEFVDLCIICGCDQTGGIDKVGPKSAFNLIKERKNIENILD